MITSPADAGYMVGERYEYNMKNIASLSENWKYGNDVEWDGNQYILKDTIESNTKNWNNDYKQIAKKYHYTCLNNTGVCSEVGYIHYFFEGSNIYYLRLNGGKKLEDIKEEMFTNKTDSAIKQFVDEWYQKNMIPYTEKLEDTVWCNDRSIDRGPLKSKDEDASILDENSATYITYFGADGRNAKTRAPSVECANLNDRFTVNIKNGNGALTYPVALLTADELTMAGHGWTGYSSESYLYTNNLNWTLSPRFFGYDYVFGFRLRAAGYLGSYYVNTALSIRPAVSLASASIIASGDGTEENPFIIA